MVLKGSKVERAETFDEDVQALLPTYPGLLIEIEGLCDDLRSNCLPGQPIPGEPDAYAVDLDYAPLGPEGRNRFVVTYVMLPLIGGSHMPDAKLYWLVSISEPP